MKKTLFFILTILLISISCQEDESNPNESGNGGTNPCEGINTVSYEGKTYNTVAIGNQCWLKENLDVGTMIQGNQNASNNGVIEKYCYDNNPSNCATYGGLYQWNEAMKYTVQSGAQGICPPGWHIPTLAELQTLASTVNNNGNALKAVGQGSGDGAGTNTSGFSALLAGQYVTNTFFGLDGYSFYWSSIETDLSKANYMSLYWGDGNLILPQREKGEGFSIRCIKD